MNNQKLGKKNRKTGLNDVCNKKDLEFYCQLMWPIWFIERSLTDITNFSYIK